MKKKFIINKDIHGHIRSHWWDIKECPFTAYTTFLNIHKKIKAFEVTFTHFTFYLGWK